jgi:hypothetical protein
MKEAKEKTRSDSIDSDDLEDRWNYILTTDETFYLKKDNKNYFKRNNKIVIYEKEDEWYEGEVDKYFMKNGHGIYNYSGGDIYDGEFKDGLRHGFGEYKYVVDNSIYRGEWWKDVKQGRGSYKFGIFELCGVFENEKFVSGLILKLNVEDNSENDFENFLSTEYENEKDKKIYFKENSIIESPPFINKKEGNIIIIFRFKYR